MAREDLESEEDLGEEDAAEKPEPLHLEVAIERTGSCQRHITVTVPRDDIERYYDKVFGELMPKANVPGFRAGHAPRKLVEHRFRKDVSDQVKGKLLMDSLTQITEEKKLAAISEPDIDVAAVEMPDDGPLTFEFDIEVRPEFDMPQWKGLTIERPTRTVTPKDIDRELERHLASRGRLVPTDGPAAPGDYIAANFTFRDGDKTINEIPDKSVRLAAVLSFPDGRIEDFAAKMTGVEARQTRTLPIVISDGRRTKKFAAARSPPRSKCSRSSGWRCRK